MSNTQRKQAKRKAKQKAKPKSSDLHLDAMARAVGASRDEVRKSLAELKDKKLIKADGSGRPQLSSKALLSMAIHEETGIFVPPSEV